MKKRMFYFNPRNDKLDQTNSSNNSNSTTKPSANQSTRIIGQPKNMPLKSAIPTPTPTPTKTSKQNQQQQQPLQPVQRSSTTLSFNSEATYDSLTSTQLNNADSMDINSCNESQVFDPKSKQHFKLFEDVKNLDLRTRQLIDKTESTLSEKVSSEGVGSSTSSTTTSNLSQLDSTLVETSHKPDFVKYLENKTILFGNNNLKSENDDILYQWRLRRKLEEAKTSTINSNNLNNFQINEPKTQMQQIQPTQNHLLLHRLTANNALLTQKLQMEKASEINSQLPPISPAVSTVTATTNTTAATTTITIPEANPQIKTVQNSVATQTNVNASVQTSLEVHTFNDTERHSLKSKYGYDEYERPTKDYMFTSQKENIYLFDNKEKSQNKSRHRVNNVIKSTVSTSTNCSIIASNEKPHQNQPILCHKSVSPTRRTRSSSVKTSILTEQSNISDLTKVSSVFDESKLYVQPKPDKEEQQKEHIKLNKETNSQQRAQPKAIEEDAEKIDSKLLEKLENDEILIMLYKQSFYYESKLKEINELLQTMGE